MRKYCAVIPNTAIKEETEAGSILYKELLAHFANNRGLASDVFWRTKNEDFISDYSEILTKYDTHDDFTFKSLWDNTDLVHWTPAKNIITNLENRFGGRKNGEPIIYKRMEDAIPKMNAFNESSNYSSTYIAKVVLRTDGNYGLIIAPKTRRLAQDVAKLKADEMLNMKLANILARAGMSIGKLTAQEKKKGVFGVSEVDQLSAKRTADGLYETVRIAEGWKGAIAIPEEIAHSLITATKHLPLVNRLINHIHDNNLAKEIIGENRYEIYVEDYKGNLMEVAEEAAGQLVAENFHIVNDELNTHGANKSLLQRVIEFIKNFIKSHFSSNEIKQAMLSANEDARDYARQVLDRSILPHVVLNSESNAKTRSMIARDIDKAREIASKAIKNTKKKLEIYGNERTTDWNDRMQLLIDQMENQFDQENFTEALYLFLQSGIRELDLLDKRLAHVNEIDAPINDVASTLMTIYNFTNSFGNIIGDIRSFLRDDAKSEYPVQKETMMDDLNKVESLVQGLRVDFSKMAEPIVWRRLEQFATPELLQYIPKNKLREQLSSLDKDISSFARHLDHTAGLTNDNIVGLVDKSIKMAKFESKQLSWEDIKTIQGAHRALEKAGVKDTKWMYEKDENGVPTGYIIDDIDWVKFNKEQKEFYAYLFDKYGDKTSLNEDRFQARWQEIKAWNKEHYEKRDDYYLPKYSKYQSENFKKLNKVQKEYYKEYTDIYDRLKSYLPGSKKYRRLAPQVRKDALERIKGATNPADLGREAWTILYTEQLKRNTDDIDFGEGAVEDGEKITKLVDFAGKPVSHLPVFFTKKLNNLNHLSLDATSGLGAYASMAHDFKAMYKDLDAFELTRIVLKDRTIYDSQGGKPIFERLKKGDLNGDRLIKDPTKVNISKRIDDLYNMQIYGRLKKDEGSVLGLDLAKSVDALNRYTSLVYMGGNSLMALSNVFTASFQMITEAAASEFYGFKNLSNANFKYSKELTNFTSQIGRRTKTNFLDLWNERFGILNDFKENIHNMNMDRRTRVGQLFGMSLLFFQQNAGEHWLQFQSALAIADTIKLKDQSGKEYKLTEAYDIKIDKNGIGRLVLKPGLTKLDGSAWTQEDEFAYERKASALNERLHGIYNKTNMAAAQQYAGFRLALMFRGWVIEPLKRRYWKGAFNNDLNSYQEGYYLTTMKYMGGVLKELRNAQWNWVSDFNKLSAHEKANIKRTIFDFATIMVISALSGLLFGDDDEEPDTFAASMLQYQLRRLYSEVMVYTPLGMAPEGLKMIQSPFAGANIIQDVMEAIQTANLLNFNEMWLEEIESGRYEGHSQAFKRWTSLLPLNNTIYKSTHPFESMQFYTNR